jgi:predicted phosphodiesterase
MRIAVIADIHGNLLALEAVLADIKTQAPDFIVNLGDCLSGPLQGRETAARLMALGYPTIRGNHDEYLITQPDELLGASDKYTKARLEDAHFDWLHGLPPRLRLEGQLLLCHGTPDDNETYLLETITAPTVVRSSEADIIDRLGDYEATLVLCGHSHLPSAVTVTRNGRPLLIVNPGSVGLQAYTDPVPPHAVENGTPHARYAILDAGHGGAWQCALKQITYDWDQAAATAHAAGRDDWANALRTGLVPR